MANDVDTEPLPPGGDAEGICSADPRRRYQAPYVMRLGSTRELTLGTGRQSNDHPAAGKKKKVGAT
jgi:hypothetical protein